MHRVPDRVRSAIQQPTERQHIGNEIDAAFTVARSDFVNAHGYGKRFIVRADEKLTAFLELERAVHAFDVSLIASATIEAVKPLQRGATEFDAQTQAKELPAPRFYHSFQIALVLVRLDHVAC